MTNWLHGRKIFIWGIWAGIMLLFLSVSKLCVSAEEQGSIQFLIPEEAGVELTLYHAAERSGEAFVWSGEFAGCEIEQPDLENAEHTRLAAEQLAAWALQKKPQGASRGQEEDGVILFTGLRPGLYLAVQSGGEEALLVQKTLIPIPYTEPGTGLENYHAAVELKYAAPDGKAILNKTDGEGNAVEGAVFALQRKTYISGEGALPEGAETGLDTGGRFLWETVRAGLSTNEQGQILMENLPFGIYRLVETQAPEGYELDTSPRFFSIEKAGEVTASNGVFHAADLNVPEIEVVNLRTERNGRLTVTKMLTNLEGKELFAAHEVFYVALFQDSERTKRVSDVKPVSFQDTSRGTAVFEQLEIGRTYYLGETDERGRLLESGMTEGKEYTPFYPEGYEVALDEAARQAALTFENVFLELPSDFYYGGELTVTKKVLRNGKAYNSEKTYYAAVFTDAEHTRRYGEVIELYMNGGSEASVTVPVSIGSREGENEIYYVAETSRDGTPLSTKAVSFSFTVDKERVEMSFTNQQEEVTITNIFKEQEPSDELPHGSDPQKKPPSNGKPSSGNPVRTGDDVPVESCLAGLAAASAVLSLLLLARRRLSEASGRDFRRGKRR